MTRIVSFVRASLVRPALAALLLGMTLVPGTAHAYRVFFGYGYGVPYPYPYYYRPPVLPAPVVVVPPPAHYAPPLAYPVGAGPFSTRCNAGAVICPLPAVAPVGNACSCPSPSGRFNGRVG